MIILILFLSPVVRITRLHLFANVTSIANAAKPKIARICVAATASYSPIPFLLRISPTACPKAPPNAYRNPLTGTFSFSFLPATAIIIPDTLTTIPIMLFRERISLRKNHPMTAVIIGARLITSCDVRDPIIVYDLNKKRSPRKKPTIPESPNQNQL